MTIMVDVNGLSKRFGSHLAVDNLSFRVSRGEVLGFLGPNGSGKTTSMRMITGYLRPDAGNALINGIDAQTDPVAARKHLGYLPEGALAYPEMTPLRYLDFVASSHGLVRAERQFRIDQVAHMTRIDTVLNQPIETLSKGYKRRVGLAHALVHDPQVLILDEPTDGLDPNQKHEVRLLIERMAAHKAIVISTHILEEVHALCTRAIVIAEGRVVADDTPSGLEALSVHHNAVSISLPREQSAKASQIISELEGVRDVVERESSQEPSTSGTTQLTAFAHSGHEIIGPIAIKARESGLSLEQIRKERGQLDEVFRELTTRASSSFHERAEITAAEGKISARKTYSRQRVWAVLTRELGGYFSTPLAYVFITIFLAGVGALTFFAGSFFEREQADLDAFFQFHPWLYLFLIPALAMRLWAEERKSGSIELLLTLPITSFDAVLGKFLAAWLVTLLALVLTSTFWWTVNYLGEPDNAVIVAGYLGSGLMAGAYLAIGMCVSVLTKNQVIAFIIACAACFLFTASGLGLVLDFFAIWAPASLLETISQFSFLDHFKNMTRGVIDLRDIAFFVSTIVLFLFATLVCLEKNKAG